MPKSKSSYLMFHLNNPIEARDFYQEVFGAGVISEEYLPNGDPYIMINLNGCNILLRPGEMAVVEGEGVGPYSIGCCAKFETEDDLKSVYALLTADGKPGHSLHTDWGWTALAAQVTDKYSVPWLLSV